MSDGIGDLPASDEVLLQKALDILTEHYDSVRIFAVRPSGSGDGVSCAVSKGVGNFYASYGQIKEWMIVQDERTRMSARHESGD